MTKKRGRRLLLTLLVLATAAFVWGCCGVEASAFAEEPQLEAAPSREAAGPPPAEGQGVDRYTPPRWLWLIGPLAVCALAIGLIVVWTRSPRDEPPPPPPPQSPQYRRPRRPGGCS